MSHQLKPRAAVGDVVRVKQGVTDVMFADMVLEGWTGTVAEIDDEMLRVRWDQETVATIPDAYRERWKADALPVDSLWLRWKDVEVSE